MHYVRYPQINIKKTISIRVLLSKLSSAIFLNVLFVYCIEQCKVKGAETLIILYNVLNGSRDSLTLIGEYHFLFWGVFLFPCFLGLGSKGSYSCSGIFTTAFLGFSSLAPSSVDPFPPQRT